MKFKANDVMMDKKYKKKVTVQTKLDDFAPIYGTTQTTLDDFGLTFVKKKKI
jgi:hypothetical protein